MNSPCQDTALSLLAASPSWRFSPKGGGGMAKKRKTHINRPEAIRQFGQRLREVRRSVGLTQRELAEKAHLSEGYVARLEAGDTSPGLDLLFRLAVALSVPLAELLPSAT